MTASGISAATDALQLEAQVLIAGHLRAIALLLLAKLQNDDMADRRVVEDARNLLLELDNLFTLSEPKDAGGEA